ncbi:protein NEDD1 isoform X1 [Henckelia pumila]|uniref:protein NEDD1 isoform X1 n=1 Tax=Henckelia pumila TaxID=405737 RepID=UPI003C6DEE1A
MNSSGSVKLLLAASGGDTVKLFDISVEPQNPCVLTHSPSPTFRVNSVKWNHNNLVLATAGEDSKISLWRKNGQSLWTVGETVEPSESISTISFSNKGSRYLCSGGTGQIVRIWDLQNNKCVRRLKGHCDTITGVMYNCKDEHIASVSRNGDLILHNLASSTKAAELRDPNGQVLGSLDYSRTSRHLLVTAGDDGSIHLWDTTGRTPKVSWSRQHSAPTSGVSFSPSNDKIIASVGLDMKLYTFDSGSRKPASCIPYEAPFSSLAFTDDGVTLAAGTSTGQVVFYDVRGKPQPITVLRAYGSSEAVTNLCWQRSKAVSVNESSCTNETVLLAGDVGDSILMPDPLPSRASSFHSMSSSNAPSLSSSEETPLRSSIVSVGSLARLHAPRNYNFKDDMEVFSPLVEVQPVTPSLDKLWDKHDGSKKDLDKKTSFLFPSRRYGFSEEGTNDNHPIFDWKSNLASKQDDVRSTFSQVTSTPTSTLADDSSSITPPEAWGGERLADKFIHHRQSINLPSRFSMLTSSSSTSGLMSGSQDNLLTNHSTNSLTSGLSLANLRVRETSSQDPSGSSEAFLSPLGSKGNTGQTNLDTLGPALSIPKRFSSYAERIGASPSFSDASSFSVASPKSKKTGAETREELLNSLLSRSEMPSASGTDALATSKDGMSQLQRAPLQSDMQPGASFTLQLFQRTLEETFASFQKSIHEDMRNLHIEILRQFHMQEMETSRAMNSILENQAEIMKELQSLRKETQMLHRLL